MIYEKLLAFQKQNITIKKDASNPHFRSSYSSLNEVLDKVKGPLNELGVVVVQFPDTEEDDNGSLVSGLRTRLLDTEDGTSVAAFLPFVGATDMQKLGGAITYARRYSLVALLGLEDEDDDGNTASGSQAAHRAAQRPTAAPKPKSPVDAEGDPFGDEIPALNID